MIFVRVFFTFSYLLSNLFTFKVIILWFYKFKKDIKEIKDTLKER